MKILIVAIALLLLSCSVPPQKQYRITGDHNTGFNIVEIDSVTE